MAETASPTVPRLLLDTESVQFRPNDMFTFVSGMKSPIYVDNRNLLGHPKQRSQVADHLAQLISDKFPEAEGVAGTATAGIAWAQAVAERLDLPMAYVRSGKKEHGTASAVEGFKKPGSKVVIVEDLLTTSGSAVTSAERLRELDMKPVAVVAIVTYGFKKSAANLESNQLPWYALTQVADVLAESPLGEADKQLVTNWLAEQDS